MAIICLACFPKDSVNSLLLRLLSRSYCELKGLKPLPLKSVSKSAPIKFTTNKASTVKIADLTGLTQKKDHRYAGHILFGSFAAFLIYFCIMREENDVDGILKGEKVSENDKVQLINLKLQLSYCQKHNLPTGPIKAKIAELEEKEIKASPFRK